MAKRRRTGTDYRIDLVMAAIRNDLRRSWTIREIAAVIGVSSSHLRRMFSDGAQTSPKKLLLDLRLQAAARLLENPTIRIKEVMQEVGFTDHSHFCRTFQRRYYSSPTEFRTEIFRRSDLDN